MAEYRSGRAAELAEGARLANQRRAAPARFRREIARVGGKSLDIGGNDGPTNQKIAS